MYVFVYIILFGSVMCVVGTPLYDFESRRESRRHKTQKTRHSNRLVCSVTLLFKIAMHVNVSQVGHWKIMNRSCPTNPAMSWQKVLFLDEQKTLHSSHNCLARILVQLGSVKSFSAPQVGSVKSACCG
jgi:hypothetical protein